MKKKSSLNTGLLFFSSSLLFCLVVVTFPYFGNYIKDNNLDLKNNVVKEETNFEPFEDTKNVVKEETKKPEKETNVKGVTFVQPKGTVKVPVLMYHQIGAMPKSGSSFYKGLYVTPYMFEQQMKFLSENNYHTLTPQEFYDILKSGKNPKNKSVLITFDDGSYGQFKYAYPILKKYKQTATFYIVSQRSPISTTQLKRMSANGMVIDSHTVLHEDLRALNSKKQIKYEVNTSKNQLEYVTGKKIVSIAYPGCVADGDVFNQVASSGYLLGFSCGSTIYHYYSHRFYLSRIHVFNTLTSFRRALEIGL